MLTILEVIDSAIKIGLGALISGITAYAILKRTQFYDLQKDMRNKKIELLKECVLKLEESISTFNEAEISIFSPQPSTNLNPSNNVNNIYTKMGDGFNKAKDSHAIACMIGEEKLSKLLDSYLDKTKEKQAHYRSNESEPNVLEINRMTREIQEIRSNIHSEVGSIFKSIYA